MESALPNKLQIPEVRPPALHRSLTVQGAQIMAILIAKESARLKLANFFACRTTSRSLPAITPSTECFAAFSSRTSSSNRS